MISKNRTYILISIITLSLTSSICFGSDNEGFQYWSAAKISLDINKDWKVAFEEEFRLGDDGGNLYRHHSDLGFLYDGLADWIDLGFNFRQVFEKDSKDKWKQENRPHLNITLKSKLLGLDIADRSRFEYRDREDKDDVWQYRNKVTIKLPLELTELKLQPYLADEVFFNFDEEDFNRNRLYAGASFDVLKNMGASVYYMWQSSKSSGEWNDIHVLGVSLQFKF